MTIDSASGHPQEVRTAAELSRLPAIHDLSGLQWTPRVIVEQAASPHSHPVLTLSTEYAGDRLLACYLHEQLHWWTSDHPGFGAAISDVSRHWPVVSTSPAGGARNDHSTWLHLIVCHLERRAMQQVVGRQHEALVLDFQVSARAVYPWIRGEVVEQERWLDQTLTARELWPDRLGECDLSAAARG